MAYYNQLLKEAGGGIVSNSQKSEREGDATIVIGIGGTGCDAVRNLKRAVYDRLKPDDEDAAVPSYKGIEFLAIDSDKTKFPKVRTSSDIDIKTEFFDISTPSITKILSEKQLLRGRKELNWMSYDDITIKSASDGAGGIRQMGRFLLFDKVDAFVETLRKTINKAIIGNSKELMIHVISGISGGTGSGCFIDVCYLLRMVLEKQMGLSDVKIMGYFFLPDVNLTVLTGNPKVASYVEKNGYAALKELDYLMNMEEGKDCFQQDYGNFSYSSNRPPVDYCYLISSTDATGMRLENGYDYCIGVVTDYILSFMSRVTLPDGVQAGQGGEGITLKGHLANLERAKSGIKKRYGAKYDYNILGAANAIMPMSDITTYLGARLFEEWKGIYLQKPTEEELSDFIRNAKLGYDTILADLTKGVTFSISFPNFDPRDVQAAKKSPVIHTCDEWTKKALGKFKENTSALLMDLEEYKVLQDSKSLIGRLYEALDLRTKDVATGPCYAKRLLYSQGNKNFLNVLDGYLAQAEEEQAAEFRQEELRKGELASAELAFQNAGFLSRRRNYEEYIKALEAWYLHLAKIDQLEAMKTVLREFRKQASALDTDYFNILTTVLETVRETFARNYEIMSSAEFGKGHKSYVWRIFEIPDIKQGLDDEVKKINAEQGLKAFLDFLSSHVNEWRGQDDKKISKMITDFMTREFNSACNKGILEYLKQKYSQYPGTLEDAIYDDIIMGKMDPKAAPLFWKSNLFKLTDIVKYCVLSIPFNSQEIEAAAEKYAINNQEYAVRKTGLTDRIFMTGLYTGVPLFSYQGLTILEESYEKELEAGRHLYEQGELDWRTYLPSPFPASYLLQDREMSHIRDEQNRCGDIYEEAKRLGILHKVGSEWKLRFSDFDFEKFKKKLGDYQEQGKVNQKKCDEILEKVRALRQDFYKEMETGTLTLLDDGMGSQEVDRKDSVNENLPQKETDIKEQVRRDNFIRFPVFVKKAEQEIKKLKALEALEQEVEKAKKEGKDESKLLSDFLNAVYMGIITVPNRGGSIKYTYIESGFPKEKVFQDTTMLYGAGALKLYQAWLTYQETEEGIRQRISSEVKGALSEMTDEMYEHAKLMKEKLGPDFMQMVSEEAAEIGKKEEADISKFYAEFHKELDRFIRLNQ